MKGLTRSAKTVLCLTFALCCFLFCACNESGGKVKTAPAAIYGGGNYKDDFNYYDGFSVNYLNVGNGDAIFINFGDGNTMLIDCGEESDLNYATVTRYLSAYAEGGLTYLVLTHPDGDHIGNAAAILNNYAVDTVFIPDLIAPENFARYDGVVGIISEKEITTVKSAVGKGVFGEDYFLIMLSPNAKGTNFSAYDAVNKTENPTADAVNDLSPIIYLEYKGVRFVFTGDAGVQQEKVALDNLNIGIIDGFLSARGKTEKVNLYGVDFLKVSHHGSADASGEEFMNALAPKNAVISVGGDNPYGHPSEEALARILGGNEDCVIYMTCTDGTVSVRVDESGTATVISAKKAA